VSREVAQEVNMLVDRAVKSLLILSLPIGLAYTLFTWHHKFNGFATTNLSFRHPIDGRPFESRGGSHEWDESIGAFPYLFYQQWHQADGTVRKELVRVDYENLTVMVAISALGFGVSLFAIKRVWASSKPLVTIMLS